MAECSGNVLAHSIIQGGWFLYVNQVASGTLLCSTGNSVSALWQTRGVGWVGNGREEKYVYLRLIHAGVWQKPTQCYRAVILQWKKEKVDGSLGKLLSRWWLRDPGSFHIVLLLSPRWSFWSPWWVLLYLAGRWGKRKKNLGDCAGHFLGTRLRSHLCYFCFNITGQNTAPEP